MRTITIDADSANLTAITDTLTQRTPPVFIAGVPLTLGFDLFTSGAPVSSSSLTSVTLEIKRPNPNQPNKIPATTDPALVKKTLVQAALGIGSHQAIFALTEQETAFCDSAVHITLHAIDTNNDTLVFCSGFLAAKNDGVHGCTSEMLSAMLSQQGAVIAVRDGEPKLIYTDAGDTLTEIDLNTLISTAEAAQTALDASLVGISNMLPKSGGTMSGDIDLGGNDLLNAGDIAASKATVTSNPATGNELTRRSYTDRYLPNIAQAVMTGGLNIYNNAAETRAAVSGTIGQNSARWLVTDDTTPLQVTITRASVWSDVLVNFCVHGSTNSDATPIWLNLQRSTDGGTTWADVVRADYHNSAQRCTASIADPNGDNESLESVSMQLIDSAADIGAGLTVLYRVTAGIRLNIHMTINTPYNNRVPRLDGSNGVITSQVNAASAVSILQAQEILTTS